MMHKDHLWGYVLKINPFAKEEDVIDIREVNDWDILIEFANGTRCLIDKLSGFHKNVIHNNIDELSEEYENKEFAYRLRTIMSSRFITQEELAERVGTSQVMISRYVSGKSMPSISMGRKIAKALRCSLDDFFDKNY